MKKILLSFLLCFSIVSAQEFLEFDYELDAYYSNASVFIDLDSDRNITDGINLKEHEIYSKLFYKTLEPNIFLIEASIHPMNLIGTYYRKDNEEKYTKENINDFNFVKALTAGFEEPYSITFFLGRMMLFSKNKNGRVGKNRAYVGYMLTIGDKSIKGNKAYDDNWSNFEFKLKGTREKKNKDLDWSFRVGARWHSRVDFVDTFYVGARRSSIDYKKSIWSLIYNTTFKSLFSFRIDNQRMTNAEIIGGKIFPTSVSGLSFGLELGYLYTSVFKYDGILKEDGIDKHQAIIRPNFKWKF